MSSVNSLGVETPPEKSGKLKFLLIAAGAALGILLLVLGGGGWLSKSTAEESEKTDTPEKDELILYQSYLEERVRTLCESVEGVESVTAAVTLAGSFESVYATELSDGNEEYVILGSGASASALFLSRSTPEISGIGIVCRGGGNATIRQELTALLSAAFHISSNRIYITQAKS